MMQKQNQIALFVFTKVGISFDLNQPYPTQLIYSQTIMGGLFVRSYRLFIKDKNHTCCIFIKRVEGQTQYLFLKFIQKRKSQSITTSLQEIQQTIGTIRKLKMLKQKQMFNFRVLVCYLDEKVNIELSSTQFMQCLAYPSKLQTMNSKDQIIREQKPDVQFEQQDCLDVVGGQELKKIKTVVWAYLDTFGAKYKDNIYYEMTKNNESKLNVNRIINTVNWIIYCQTIDKPYNQLQSSNWTCFQAQAKQKCKSDRKEIVLTGSGRILYIPLLFICEKIDLYKKQCQRQLNQIIHQSRNYYVEAEIKAYLITDEIDHQGLIYKTQNDSLRKFNNKSLPCLI